MGRQLAWPGMLTSPLAPPPSSGVGIVKIALLLLVTIAGYTQGSWGRMTPFVNYVYDADSACAAAGRGCGRGGPAAHRSARPCEEHVRLRAPVLQLLAMQLTALLILWA